VKRFERDEIDARPIEAKPEPVHGDEEGTGYDQPTVIERC
jgi:hypothetical protein